MLSQNASTYKKNMKHINIVFYIIYIQPYNTALGLGEWTRTQARLMQVDSGMTNLVWGIDSTEKAFIMAEENALRPVNPTPITSIRHVTAGGAGVWAIDDSGRIFFRLGTNDYNKRGTYY